MVGNTIPHENLTISVIGNPRLVMGKKNYALQVCASHSSSLTVVTVNVPITYPAAKIHKNV